MPKSSNKATVSMKETPDHLFGAEGRKEVAEGGCGVLGVACTVPIEGKYLLQPMLQMHNRGNGKGGGIAAV
nr:hypothetical protein [Candidatus Njordarchaeum guaymaensis]